MDSEASRRDLHEHRLRLLKIKTPEAIIAAHELSEGSARRLRTVQPQGLRTAQPLEIHP